jgi:lipopolysaccharide export system protein LptA
MRRALSAALLAGFALPAAVFFTAATSGSSAQPLIMENADRMEGMRSSGEYILSGNVRFRHGDLRFETQRALWQRSLNRVSSQDGMRITHRGSLLTSDRGSYDRNGSQAVAEGRVFMRDSAGEVNGRAHRLDYDRVRRVAVLTGEPVVQRFYPQKTDEAGKVTRPDTLTIRGLKLRYNDAAGIAEAEGNVVITRRDLRITCGRAEYRKHQDSLLLYERPIVRSGENEMRGKVIRLGLQGESLKGLGVREEAELFSFEKATDTSAARHSRVVGDSMNMVFQEGMIDSLQVFHKARGTYWEVDRPQYVNQMDGDYMVLRFQEKQPREAEVLGSARSTYYHFEQDTLKGKNRAAGDTIQFGFKDGKVHEVLVKGRATGVYEGRGLGKARDSAGNGKGR